MSSLIWENQSISRGTFGGAFPALPSLHTKLSFPKTMGLNFSEVEVLLIIIHEEFKVIEMFNCITKSFILSVTYFYSEFDILQYLLDLMLFSWKEIIIVKFYIAIKQRKHFQLNGFLIFLQAWMKFCKILQVSNPKVIYTWLLNA